MKTGKCRMHMFKQRRLDGEILLLSTPRVPSGPPSDGEFSLDRSSSSLTNPTSTSAWPSEMLPLLISPDDDSNSSTPQKDRSSQQSSKSGDSTQGLAEERMDSEDGDSNGKTADNREKAEEPNSADRDDILGEKHACANVGSKCLMKQVNQRVETTQISFKVKLRRRTKGELWEVVSMHDTDETLSVRTSLKQTDLTNHQASSVQTGPIHKPETPIVQPAPDFSSGPPAHPNTMSDSQPFCNDSLPPNQNIALESVTLNPPPGPMEESDEQIEKLLEDIMMGLNILPNLDGDCKMSHHVQSSHDVAPAIGQVQIQENDRAQSQVHSAAGCVCFQDLGTHIGHSSTDTDSLEGEFNAPTKSPHCNIYACQPSITPNRKPNTNHFSFVNSRWTDGCLPTCCSGVHCCFTAQNQHSGLSLSAVQSDAVLIRQQQQQFNVGNSLVTSAGQRDGMSLPLSKSQSCPYPDAPATRSVIPSTLSHYPSCQVPSSQDDQNILEFLPLTNGHVAQSSLSSSFPCIEELRLPRCLSPLGPLASAAKHPPFFNNLTNHGDKTQPQPSLNCPPWLAENSGSLQFPLCAIAHRENKSECSPKSTNHSCSSEQQQTRQELSPKQKRPRAEAFTVKEVEEQETKFAAHKTGTEEKSDHWRKKYKQGDTKGDAAVPERRRRKRTIHPQDAAVSLQAHKQVSDQAKSQINLSVCSVSLSSNNVLAKEREMATSSSDIANKFSGQKDETSIIPDSWVVKTRAARNVITAQAWIRTRGFLKNTQETPSNTCQENSSFIKPVAHRAKISDEQGVSGFRRKYGRRKKTKPEESLPAISEKRSHCEENEHQIDNILPNEEEAGEKTKKRSKIRKRDRSKVEAIPPKKTKSGKITGTVEAGDNSDVIQGENKPGTPKRPRMVTLMEFQNLIKYRHSKTWKSIESENKETNVTVRAGESEEKARGGRREELIKETEVDKDRERSHSIVGITVDKNHNQIFNSSTAECNKSHGDDTKSSCSEGTSVLGNENHPSFSFNVLEQEVAGVAAKAETPLRTPDEGKVFRKAPTLVLSGAQKACGAGVWDATPQTGINDEGSSHSDTHPPQQEQAMLLEHNMEPLTPERPGPAPSDSGGFIKSSGCSREKAEDDDEEEVDILLYSPDKVPQFRGHEKTLDNIDSTAEEEEEEDVNEIDVTGDEAE
ncbi:uncharacterized protein LOC119021055 isoform X4 [Acanthopagrus latus]|uniref:uncharacterized protein LOC119021055 isoform X4 n=1 Tax=Acanthopagrus latus TaxID=8177 RepID=UPI00187C86E8|nr:uncharacterized protein LOC119021055 isoform X4 [Acanthopagrus latus]